MKNNAILRSPLRTTVPLSIVVLSIAHVGYSQSTTRSCQRNRDSDSDDDQHGDDDDDDDDGENDDPNDHCTASNGNGGGQDGGRNSTPSPTARVSTITTGTITGTTYTTASVTQGASAGATGTASSSEETGSPTTSGLTTDSRGGRFNKASIAGIILGILCLMLFFALIFHCVRKRRKDKIKNWIESKRDFEGSRTYNNIGSGQDGVKPPTTSAGGFAIANEQGEAPNSIMDQRSSRQWQPSTTEDNRTSLSNSLPQSAVSVPLALHPGVMGFYDTAYTHTSTDFSTHPSQPYSTISTPLYGISYPNPMVGTSRGSYPPTSFPASIASTYPDTPISTARHSSLVNPYDVASLGTVQEDTVAGDRHLSITSQGTSLHDELVVHQKQLAMEHRQMELEQVERAASGIPEGVPPTGSATPAHEPPPPEYRPFNT